MISTTASASFQFSRSNERIFARLVQGVVWSTMVSSRVGAGSDEEEGDAEDKGRGAVWRMIGVGGSSEYASLMFRTLL